MTSTRSSFSSTIVGGGRDSPRPRAARSTYSRAESLLTRVLKLLGPRPASPSSSSSSSSKKATRKNDRSNAAAAAATSDGASDSTVVDAAIAPSAHPIDDGDAVVHDLSIQDALAGARVMVTGAAGFVGAALLHRLLCDPSFNVQQVIAVVRGKTDEDALKRLPKSVQHLATAEEGQLLAPKLIVVNGDCTRPNFGLSDKEFEKVRQTEVVIHCAGDTRFTLPLTKAFESMADLAYFTARFSLLTKSVKTHIHISTTYVGWYLKDGSLVTESLTPEGCGSRVDAHATHVNTYFEAKTYAESCINSLFTSQVGRPLHGKTCRIVRLATLGPAAAYPRPAWGAGHPSSPVCAVLAAHPFSVDLIAPGAKLDIIPVDLAVNQILAVAASAHALHRLPASHRLSPKNPAAPTNAHMAEVPIYHVACGRGDEVPIAVLNSTSVKIAEPYIPAKNLLKVYDPFICKVVEFDVVRTRAVLGLPTLKADQDRAVEKSSLPDLSLAPGPLPIDIVGAVKDIWGPSVDEAWSGYLKMIRDEMEAMGSRDDWETFVD
ncbi:male sterility protein-domain-containing protein [Zopfochytrium polystomum]|nr:male sterility protein-domain-containing protein [Zopfochytrium polystomum]